MPTVVLQGGLGNQLFQYAVGRALSIKTNSKLYLEISRLTQPPKPNLTPRTFQLPHFNIQGEAIFQQVRKSLISKLKIKTFDLLEKMSPKRAAQICMVYKNRSPHRYAPYVLDLPANVLLFGYYQSEKYFLQIEDTLREELSLSKEPTGPNQKWGMQIDGCNSASVHIRRGDYTELGWDLPVTYYRSAIEKIDSTENDVELFFFSDEMGATKEHIEEFLPSTFSASEVHFVDCNDGQEAYEVLRLMTACYHNTVANNTLSWWGAWLNQHDEKLVFTRAYWIDHVRSLDIIPNRWPDWR